MDEEKVKQMLGVLARIVFAIVALYCVWDVIKTQALFLNWEPDDTPSSPASVSAPASAPGSSAAS
ncbi:MAG: hypothetical protein SOT69_01370 [Mesosutterella sp.]|nr:hypothetical protein [Mesosutterella sp.]